MSILAKVVEIDGEEVVILENTPTEAVEFRLYYDNFGKILFYTCEKLEGNYLIIDKQTYAEMRYDLKVVNDKLIKYIPGVIISKLKPDNNEGTICAKENVSIIVNEAYADSQKWKMTSYEI